MNKWSPWLGWVAGGTGRVGMPPFLEHHVPAQEKHLPVPPPGFIYWCCVWMVVCVEGADGCKGHSMFRQHGSDMDMQPVKKKRHIFDVWGNGDIIFIIF